MTTTTTIIRAGQWVLDVMFPPVIPDRELLPKGGRMVLPPKGWA